MSDIQKTIAIIGGGPAGLMAAQYLSLNSHFDVHVYEQKPSVGRKFLIAGRGGLNLTHSENTEMFNRRYGPAETFLTPALTNFTPDDLVKWATDLGIETFVGSSGRIFPKEMKATGLMRAWTKKLTAQGVTFHLRHEFIGLDKKQTPQFIDQHGKHHTIIADAVLFAMGGASYPHLGATGSWVPVLKEQEIPVTDLTPANCGFTLTWSDHMLQKFEGQPLKNVSLFHKGESARGDLVITNYGLEGGAIYALSRALSATLQNGSPARMAIDLRPDLTVEQIAEKLSAPRKKQSLSSFWRKQLRLSPVEISLIHEFAPKNQLDSPASTAALIKALPLTLTGIRPIERAISSAGGVGRQALDQNMMLENHPGWFVAGEMIDWDAPTGGYLLQACFSTGMTAAHGIENWLQEN